jgi:iron complex outermembrane recepter protein
VRPAHADRRSSTRAHRRVAVVVAILGAAAASSVRVGAQPSRSCTSAGAEVVTQHGVWPSPLDAVVTLRARDISLREALDRLGAGSGVPLAYSSDLLPLDRSVCVDADRQPLGLVLATLLAGTRVQPQVVAHKVVLAPIAGARETQPARVSVLERVIVTGSAIAASRRPFAVGVEVIDGDELRLGGAGGLTTALDAYVPGLWVWDQAPGSLVAQYGGVRGASSFSTS